MRLKNVQRNDVERSLVRGFQIHRTRFASVHGQQPRSRTNAPRISGFQTGKIESRRRCDEIVAHITSKEQEVVVQYAADGVRSAIVFIGVATTVSVPAGQWVPGTGLKIRP